MKKRKHIARGTSNVFRILTECVIVVFLCAVGLFLRTQEINRSIQGMDEIPRIYTMAFISGNGEISVPEDGIDRFYIYMLQGVFRLFGNKERVGMWMQVMLQMFTLVMLYLSIRKLWSIMVSGIGFAVLMLLPPMIKESVLPSSDIVLFAGVSVLFILLTCIVRNQKNLVWYLFPLLACWAVLGYFTEDFWRSVYFYVILSVFLVIGAGSIRRSRSEYRVITPNVSEYVSKNEVFLDMEPDAEKEGKSIKPMDVVNKKPETPAVTNFIENPLPIPKRHKKPMLHFDYDVPKDRDYFDVYVADSDDFDI